MSIRQRSEVEDGGGESEGERHCDQVQLRLAGIESGADRRQRHVGDAEVDVRDDGTEDQDGEDRTGPLGSLGMDVRSGRLQLAPLGSVMSLRSRAIDPDGTGYRRTHGTSAHQQSLVSLSIAQTLGLPTVR